tara:strand:- start:660 stop:983 length:324 start_codon:yes stop_codon:yes gene_type:complete
MIKLTPSALDQMKRLLSQREGKHHGIKVGINTKGCSGLSYTLEYVEKIDKSDELIKFDDLNLFVDPKASLFMIGTEVDYIKGELESGFKFTNPNEKGRCGCGESFHV